MMRSVMRQDLFADKVRSPERAATGLVLPFVMAPKASHVAVTAQASSGHPVRILAGGSEAVEIGDGRRSVVRSAPKVVAVLERLLSPSPAEPSDRRAPDPRAELSRSGRCCHDHLAGKLGVAVTRATLWIGNASPPDEGKAFRITFSGSMWFGWPGCRSWRGFARWMDREPHLAGPQGTGFLALRLDTGTVLPSGVLPVH